jgi:hypothetical protein
MTPRLHPLLYSPQSIHGALVAQLPLLLAGSNAAVEYHSFIFIRPLPSLPGPPLFRARFESRSDPLCVLAGVRGEAGDAG